MKTKLVLLTIIIIGFLSGCNQSTKDRNTNEQKVEKADRNILGKWVRIGHTGPIGFDFKEDGKIEGDFGNDGTVDIIAQYELSGDTIRFIDKEGQMCEGNGLYKIYQTEYYLAFDLIEDNCGGRIKSTLGYWTKPDFSNLIKKLGQEIENSPKPELYLNRARIYLAIGKSNQAKADLDTYLSSDTTNADAYINRAGTRFPNDLEGVVLDCNKAIGLEPNNKNAFFLRGLARYDLGEEEQACSDFSKAIELGFSVLRIAEQEKCAEFWNE